MINATKEIAKKAHAGHKDKAGVDYYTGHLTAVANLVTDPIHKAIAYLHDIIEDTAYTAETLKKELTEKGVDAKTAERITNAVAALTKTGDDYDAYLKAIANNPDAKAVKIADMTHNADLTRLNTPTKKDIERKAKYDAGIAYLNAV